MNKLLKRIPKMDLLRLLLVIFLVVGVIFPIIAMLFQIDINDVKKIFNDSLFYEKLFNSIYSTLISTIISVIIALLCAYLLNRSNIKRKDVYIVLLTIPMLIPSISHALGLINLFGENGFLDKLFGFKGEIYGIKGLIIGSVMYSFPVAFLLIYDSLKYEDKSIYDAASTLGIKPIRAFFSLTIPYLKTTLISSFFAVFTMIFTDYGVPLAIGGKFQTLPVYIFQEVINLSHFSKGAIIGLVFLLPAVIAFIYDFKTKDEAPTEKGRSKLPVSRLFNVIAYIILTIVVIIIIMPQIAFAITSFVKSFPNDMSFSIEHLNYALDRRLDEFYLNSLIISILTGLFGTIVSYMSAYLSTRIGGKVGKILHFIAITSLAVPGIVLGIGFIFLYKKTFIYNTMIILILVNMIHFFSSPYLLAKNALNKLNHSYEDVGATIGVSRLRILINVLIPNTLGTIFEMFSYFFINSMITISAVSFLYTWKNQPVSLLIHQWSNQLEYEAAAIVSLLILFTNIIFKIIVSILKKMVKKKENKSINIRGKNTNIIETNIN